MKALLIKLAKLLYRNVHKFDLTYDDKDVKELGELIKKMEESEEK